MKQIPEKSAVALVTFPSIGQASNTVIHSMKYSQCRHSQLTSIIAIQQGISIGRAELLDDVMMKAVNLSSGTSYHSSPFLRYILLFDVMKIRGTKYTIVRV